MFYKQQGETFADIGVNQGLNKDDFALHHIRQKSCIYVATTKWFVDSTHGTNGYDFKLISIVVVDQFGEGFLVAWCFSNWEDKILLMNFFSHLKHQIGNVKPQWLMSDDTEQFYSAWIATI